MTKASPKRADKRIKQAKAELFETPQIDTLGPGDEALIFRADGMMFIRTKHHEAGERLSPVAMILTGIALILGTPGEGQEFGDKMVKRCMDSIRDGAGGTAVNIDRGPLN